MENLLSKHTLRAQLRGKRQALASERREEASKALLLDLLPTLASAEYILSFASFDHEIDTSLVNLYLAQTKRLLLPKTSGKHLRIFHVSSPEKDLVPNGFGLWEPHPELCKEIDPRLIEIALVPALGFDLKGHRLGYGYGFYDRFLKSLPLTQTIGIGFKEQLVPALPTGPRDVPLTKVSLF